MKVVAEARKEMVVVVGGTHTPYIQTYIVMHCFLIGWANP